MNGGSGWGGGINIAHCILSTIPVLMYKMITSTLLCVDDLREEVTLPAELLHHYRLPATNVTADFICPYLQGSTYV